MSIYRDKARGRLVFEFDRYLEGGRVRTRKILPATWDRAKADAYDRKETARLYAIASRVERAQYSIEDAIAKYLKERGPDLKSLRIIEKEIAQMDWAYRGKPITELAAVCQLYTAKATRDDDKPLAPATLRNRLRYLMAACRYGWKHHHMCEHDPAERVISPTVRNDRHKTIDRKQMLQLCRACPDKGTRAAVRIAFYSGMRLGEIRRAGRENGLFTLDDTKNGTPRHIPIHPKLRTCLRYEMLDQSTISRHFRKARAAVGLDWLHFHDLRHSAASQMINFGVDLYTVGAVLGHKSAQSTKRYAHLATHALVGAIGTIGGGTGQHFPHPKKNRAA